MSELTNIELKVLEAFDNEALELTPKQRDQQFLHYVQTWNNAQVYADQWGFTVEEFRAAIKQLSGYSGKEL